MGIKAEQWQEFCRNNRRSVDDGSRLASETARHASQLTASAFLSNGDTSTHPKPVPDRSWANSELEHRSGHGPLAAGQGQEEAAGRILVRIISVRKRLCDPDNLCEKWLLDCLRYCRCLPGDEPDKITLETSQRKAAKGEAEKTEIEVIWPPSVCTGNTP